MSTSTPKISVTRPVGPALERMKMILFRPFDLGKWIAIGFCSWLAGKSMGFQFNYHASTSNRYLMRSFSQVKEYVLHHLYWVLPTSIVVVLLVIGLALFLLWLQCRGQFMFLDCVVLNRGAVSAPWKNYKNEARSLFWFCLVLSVLYLVNLLILSGIIVWVVLRYTHHGHFDFHQMLLLIPIGVGSITVGLIWALVHVFTAHFVVPLMYLRRMSCLDAWDVILSLLRTRPWGFIKYLLFQIVLGIATGVIVLFAVLCTCCIAGILMVLPVIGAVFLLPVTVFFKSYQLLYLAQYGSEYNLLREPPPIPEVSESHLG